MPYSHPSSKLPKLPPGEKISETSRQFLENNGFTIEVLQPDVSFQIDEDLISSQIEHFGKSRLNEFIKHGFLRFVPSYHWQVLWIDNRDIDYDNIAIESYRHPEGNAIFRTIHSPDGAIQQFHIQDSVGLDLMSPGVSREDPPDVADPQAGELQYDLPGHRHLKNLIRGTVWSNYMMQVDSTSHSEQFDLPVNKVMLRPTTEIFEHLALITVTTSSNGNLLEIDQDVTISGYENPASNALIEIVRFIFYIVTGLILLATFFRRLFYRLIDVRAATFYSVAAAGLVMLYLIYLMIQGSAFMLIEHQPLIILALVVVILLFSVISGILVFMITGIGESLTREVWPQKLVSLSLLRLGYFKSRLTGRALITGVLSALTLLGASAVIYAVADHSYLNPLEEQVFYSDSYLFYPWQIFMKSLLWMFLVTIGLFSFFISWIAINKNTNLLLLAAGGAAFALMSSYYVDTPDIISTLAFWFVPGVIATYLFLKYDLLTLLVSVFLFILAWSTAHSWMITSSPDTPIAWFVFGLTGMLLVTGGYLVNYGKEYDNIPELTPEYIRRISREQRVERELEIAHQVHRSFLPVNLPKMEGLDIAADCKAAFEVGGDYYDVIRVDDHRMAFVIGDVSGKGIQAAFYMTMVKGIFQSLVKEISEPVPLLTRMNRLFYNNAQRGSFISICYGLLDVRSGELRLARAGHNPAILLQNSRETISVLRPGGLAIGLVNGREFEQNLKEEKVHLQTGDTLVFYTDGITEATNSRNEMFGDDRLIEYLKTNRNQPAGELLRNTAATVRRFAGNNIVIDDMTMLVVTYTKKGAADT